jgi:hypothetical protein
MPGGRGFDGTTATAHSPSPGNVTHVCSSAELDDANAHIYTPARDDHTQYVRTDGTRSITGNLTVASNLAVGGTVVAGAQVTAPTLQVLGVGGVGAGETAPARFVGATVSGPPTGGTWIASDFVVTGAGEVWVCAFGGTPGTWLKVGTSSAAGVTQILAGNNININPAGGTGAVTINASGGTSPTAGNSQSFIPSNVSLPGGTLTAIVTLGPFTGTSKVWLLNGHIQFSPSASLEVVDFGFFVPGLGYVGMTSADIPGTTMTSLDYCIMWNSGSNSSYSFQLVCYPQQTSLAYAFAANTSQANATGMVAVALT